MAEILSKRPQRILITGASGCIGHYVVETLVEQTDHELFLLMRNPAKLRVNLDQRPGVHVLEGNLHQVDEYADLLSTMDTAVLIATCWGGADEIYAINVDANLRLMELLDPDRCRQVLYFSTASILDQQNQPMQAAGEIGTDYIRSKYLCHQKLAQLAIAPQITTLFPTLVFGGAADKPYSHISAGLTDVVGWMHLIRWLKADGSFHFIHAQDIAAVVRHLIEAPPVDGPRELVLGNPAITVNQAIADASAYLGYPLPWQIPVSLGLADFLIKTFKFRMAEWDRFCLHYRHFTYQNPVSPTTLGLPAYCPSLTRLLQLGGVDPWYPYGLPAAPL